MASLATIRRDIKDIGALATLTYALGKMLRKAGIGQALSYHVVAVDLNAVAALPGAKQPASLHNLADGNPDLYSGDAPASVVEQRLRMGGKCHVLKRPDQTPVAWIWHQNRRYEEDEVRAVFQIPANAVWDYGVYIPQEFRAGRALAQLWSAFAKSMVANGVGYSVSRIGTHNTASLRAHRRLPHRFLAHCIFISLGRFQFSFSSVAPYFHVCASEKGSPVFDFGSLDA